MKYRSQFTTYTLGAVAAIGMSLSAIAAEPPVSSIHADNDGIGLHVAVSSEHEVLSVKLRVTGPDNFLVEKRVESTALDWVPDGDLPDGRYSWEAWVVSVHPNAEVIEPLAERNTINVSESQIPDGHHARLEQAEPEKEEPIPLEHYFRSQDKHVERQSGQFQVEHGMMHALDDGDEINDRPLTSSESPGALMRLAGAALELLVPSAHAEEVFNTDIRIQKSVPRFNLESTGSGAGEWRFWIGQTTGDLYFQDRDGVNNIMRFEKGSVADSIYVRAGGSRARIGIQTQSPSDTLHAAHSGPQFRLEDTSESRSWYVRNQNEGRFEISHMRTGAGQTNSERWNPFTIEPDAMDGSLYIRRTSNCFVDPFGNVICIPANRVGISTTEPSADLHIVPTGISSGQIKIGSDDAKNTSIRGGGSGFDVSVSEVSGSQLRIDSDTGNVGIGTSSPTRKLHVRGQEDAVIRVENTSGTTQFRDMFRLVNNGGTMFKMRNQSNTWEFAGFDDRFQINNLSSSGITLRLDQATGDLEIKGQLEENSSREVKHDITELDPNQLLETLESLQIAKWKYNHNPDAIRVGPMAEDWYAAFSLGTNDTTISPSDMAGVALAAAKALNKRNTELAQQNTELQARLERLEAEILNN